MWKSVLDPFIIPLPTNSPAFLPILVRVPGYLQSIHIALYLPTSGHDPQFVSALSLLDTFLDEVCSIHNCPVFIRGDANSNPNNHVRSVLLKHFSSKHHLLSIDFGHPSHHHFTGNGLHDAQLDVLLHQAHGDQPTEVLDSLVCKLQHPLIDSAHDIVLSNCHLPAQNEIVRNTSENKEAPKIPNKRTKIKWEESNIEKYQSLVVPNLVRIRETWSDHNCPAAVSMLLQATNNVLSTCAAATNKVVELGKEFTPRTVTDPSVSVAQNRLLRLSKHTKILVSSEVATDAQVLDAKKSVSASRCAYKRAINAANLQACNQRDTLIHSVLDSDPSTLFKAIKSTKSAETSKISSLKVGNKVYSGTAVTDGFFDSLFSLKSPDMSTIHSSPSYHIIIITPSEKSVLGELKSLIFLPKLLQRSCII